MSGAEYLVHLDAFEGPMDLLLFLIRRAEVEITDIPIATITSQYLEYLGQMDAGGAGGGSGVDIERAGEFLVMAATLMEIKSRMIGPPPAGERSASRSDADEKAGEQADPRAELVKQLLEYKRFRDASDVLVEVKRRWEDRFGAARAQAGKPEVDQQAQKAEAEGRVELEDVHVVDLVEAFARIVETVDFSRVAAGGAHHVLMDDVPVEVHAEDVVERLRGVVQTGAGGAGLEFAELFRGRTKSDAIGLFLAVLELVKQQKVLVRQEAPGEGQAGPGKIVLQLNEQDAQEGGLRDAQNAGA